MYQVKEAFYTLQGEGAHTGRPSVFCRFSGCNLWSGREADRARAQCTFCDTDFVGTDGQNGGRFQEPDELAAHLDALWPAQSAHKYVVFTGGEPLLQLDSALTEAMHQRGFTVAVESNGTQHPPPGIDWLCISPKGRARVVVDRCDELKLVYPQADAPPNRFSHIEASAYYLSPMNDPHKDVISTDTDHTQAALAYCLGHPQWRLTLQTHKLLRIE